MIVVVDKLQRSDHAAPSSWFISPQSWPLRAAMAAKGAIAKELGVGKGSVHRILKASAAS